MHIPPSSLISFCLTNPSWLMAIPLGVYLCGCWNRTLWANHALTARELRKWWQRTSYHSVAVPRRVFFVWNPVWNRNLDASWTLNIASSSNSGVCKQITLHDRSSIIFPIFKYDSVCHRTLFYEYLKHKKCMESNLNFINFYSILFLIFLT